MKAVVQHRYGASDQLTIDEISVPEPGDGEVLVEVSRVGLHIGDVHLMTGKPYAMRAMGFGVRGPKAPPGTEVAGTVSALGPGVTEFAVGDDVVGIGAGTLASYCVAPVKKLVRRPASFSVEPAVALPVSGITALQALRDVGGVRSGQRVLIIGAGGAVGRYAVQIARHYGARVTGLCSTRRTETVRNLGADDVVDYTTTDMFDGARRFDLVIDTAGNRRLTLLRRALTRDGTLVIVGSETGGTVLGGLDRVLCALVVSPTTKQTLRGLVSKEVASDIQVMCDLAVAGDVTPIVDRVVPLHDVSDAYRYLQSGRPLGKVVVRL